MKAKLAAIIGIAALTATSGAVLAHHSFAMFDQENPIELVGAVKEFKFTSPHTFILLKVKGNESTTLVDAEKAAWAMLRQHPVRSWTLVDELGVGHSVQLSINDFF